MQKHYLRTMAAAAALLAAAPAGAQTVTETLYTLQMTSQKGRVRSVTLKNDADFTGPKIIPATGKLIFRGNTYDIADQAYFTMKVTTRTVDGIEEVAATEETAGRQAKGNVYSLDGRLVRTDATTLDGLGKGIYIMNERKYVVK